MCVFLKQRVWNIESAPISFIFWIWRRYRSQWHGDFKVPFSVMYHPIRANPISIQLGSCRRSWFNQLRRNTLRMRRERKKSTGLPTMMRRRKFGWNRKISRESLGFSWFLVFRFRTSYCSPSSYKWPFAQETNGQDIITQSRREGGVGTIPSSDSWTTHIERWPKGCIRTSTLDFKRWMKLGSEGY